MYPSKTYKDTIIESLSSKNLAVDIRFPDSDKIMGALDCKIYEYLQHVKNNEIDEANKAAERLAVADDIANEWVKIIEAYDKEKLPIDPSIKVQYQRSLGIYKPPQDYNYIGNIRYFVWVLGEHEICAYGMLNFKLNMNITSRYPRIPFLSSLTSRLPYPLSFYCCCNKYCFCWLGGLAQSYPCCQS